jgi:hypothetical protein
VTAAVAVDAATREALQRVATHVLARGRYALTGRFGLRATPGGFGTPAFGEGTQVLRLSGAVLVVERDGVVRTAPLAGATLAGLAAVAGVDLAAPFEVGRDTPPLGDVDAPLTVDPQAVVAMADWYALGAGVLDAVVLALGDAGRPSTTQLWPEHFDLACDVAYAAGEGHRANLGFSPGDGYLAEPYCYVGPWTTHHPGDAAYWNAPFGATLTRADLATEEHPAAAAAAFLWKGLDLLAA